MPVLTGPIMPASRARYASPRARMRRPQTILPRPAAEQKEPRRGAGLRLGLVTITPVDLTTFLPARHAWTMAMPEVSETDFAIVVFREDDGWNADVLPVAVTDDLNGFIRALRQQPSLAGTIGLAGIDDYFFVAVRMIGNQLSVLLSDIGAALDYPLAEQVLD